MRKRPGITLVIMLLLNCTYGTRHYEDYESTKIQPIVVSVRVGEKIEPEEREQFDLFPGIENFKAAVFYGIEKGGYEIEIIIEDEKLVAVNRDPMAIKILREYIDRYEEVKYSKQEFEKEWHIVDYDNLGQPITQDEINQVRMWGGCCLMGMGCGIVGIIPGAIIGLSFSPGSGFTDMENLGYAFGGAFIGGLTSVIIGILIGQHIDRKNALEAIKDIRKPRVIKPNHNPQVLMSTELGDIVIRVYINKAPITATNFLRYVDENRFKEAHFYRVVTMDNQPSNDVRIEVIQGGIGFIESDLRLPTIIHETTDKTDILHKDGVLSMARAEPGTASSEFFICIGDQPELDFGGKRNPDNQGFAAFGRVIKGMDVVRKIQEQPEQDQMLISPIKVIKVTRIKK